MKISKKTLLITGGIFTLASFGLMFISVSAIGYDNWDIELRAKPDNAIQHFQNVKMISENLNNDAYAIIKKIGGFVWIETNNNFLLTNTGENSNKIIKGTERSSILGGKNNIIKGGDNETILGGTGNTIYSGNSNNILGGDSNNLTGGENSTIFGGKNNEISGSNSTIIGGKANTITADSATIIGNNSEANGYNSVAIGSEAKVNGENSFLWNDGKNTVELTNDNVFVVIGEHGMVVNTKKAHSFAQLTIGGSLVLYYDENAPQCNGETKGVVKILNNDNKKCLCSCDGSGRNALHDGIMCPYICSNTQPDLPECGHVERDCNGGTPQYSYKGVGASGACAKGTLVEGTGAFLVTTKKESTGLTNYINRSCQSDTGIVVQCHDKLEGDGCENHLGGGHCIGDINDATPIAGSNQAPSEDTQKRAYRRNEYSNQDCAYFCNTGFVAFEGKCYKCEDGTRNENDPDVCSFNVECKEGRHWNGNNCVLDAYCKNAQTNSIVKETDIETNYLKNTITTLETIIPKETSDDYYLNCIDDGNYKSEYIENTCSYKCKPGYYCNNGTCTLPSCRSKESLSDSYGDKNYYYVTGHAGYSNFNSAPTFIKDGEDQTSERFYNKYANKNGCYYWCPKENRLYYKNMRRCYSPEKKAEIQNNMEPYCGQTYLYGYGASYKNPESPNQSWTYVSPKTLAEKKANNAKGCFLSCEEGSIYAYQQAIRIYTYTNWWKAGEKLIFNSTAKSCFKKCDSDKGEILNKNGRCEVCPDGQIPNPESYQIGKFGRVGNDGKTPPRLQTYDNLVTAPEWIYNDFGQYRNCIIGCDPGYVLTDNICEKISEDGKCAGWIDKDGKCKVCLYKGQMYSETAGTCIDKKSILEFSITNTDPQGNKKTYLKGEKINYKVTIKNTGNLTIKNIKGLSYILSGDEKKLPNIGSKSIGELSPGNSTGYTLSYTLTENDFKELSSGHTGDFKIIVTATGTVVDNYIKDITIIPNTLKIIIKKP